MIRLLGIAVLALGLSACGARVKLAPQAGKSMPMKPETARAVPTVDQLITPDTQARPKRSDEELKRAEERREDKFDLPPA